MTRAGAGEGDALEQDGDGDHADAPPADRHVLIVEDERELAELLAAWVRRHYGDRTRVEIATSVDAGIAMLSELPGVDIALLDRRFPEGTGDTLLETVRSRFDPIVVMITAVEPEAGLIRLPVTDYLVKPIDRETLIKRLALLEKLRTAGALTDYTNARKASLLEYHLDDPTADPLFRRFAARWSYDRLEVIADREDAAVYELYLGRPVDAAGADRSVEVSVVGTVSEPVTELVAAGELEAVGELVPSGETYAWIDVAPTRSPDLPDDGYVVYEFTGDTPETYVRPGRMPDADRLERLLERTYD